MVGMVEEQMTLIPTLDSLRCPHCNSSIVSSVKEGRYRCEMCGEYFRVM